MNSPKQNALVTCCFCCCCCSPNCSSTFGEEDFNLRLQRDLAQEGKLDENPSEPVSPVMQSGNRAHHVLCCLVPKNNITQPNLEIVYGICILVVQLLVQDTTVTQNGHAPFKLLLAT